MRVQSEAHILGLVGSTPTPATKIKEVIFIQKIAGFSDCGKVYLHLYYIQFHFNKRQFQIKVYLQPNLRLHWSISDRIDKYRFTDYDYPFNGRLE